MVTKMHRTWSYNEISRRYTSEDIEFYIPTELRLQAEDNRQASRDSTVEYFDIFSLGNFPHVDSSVFVSGSKYVHIPHSGGPYMGVDTLLYWYSQRALDCYNQLIDQRVAREQARMVLPQNMYTIFYATVDLHNLFHFLKLRNSPHAQYEMRLYAQALEDIVKEIVPESYKLWKEINNG